MTTKSPRPGAHGEGIPDSSHAYVADPEGKITIPAGTLRVGQRVTLRTAPEPSRTLTVRFTYKRKGHPRAALEAVLAGISKTVFETEILDEH